MTTFVKRPLYNEETKKFDRKFALFAYGILIFIIIVSTYLHHCRPEVLSVPSNKDVSTWVNPTFEQTCIYQRMTEEERAKVRSEGIPHSSHPRMLLVDIFSIFMASLAFFHARKYYGAWMANCFMIGSFVFTGLEESFFILVGRFTDFSKYPSLMVDPPTGTYWFTKGGLWFFETPVTACVSWFFIAYSCVWVAGMIFPKFNLYGRAFFGGMIAMVIDLWMDPIATSPEWMNWVWARGGEIISILGIPQSNFFGWFLLIFVFAILWEYLIKWEEQWGRVKTTFVFFTVLLIADIMVSAVQLPWMLLLASILKLAGFDHTVFIPSGW